MTALVSTVALMVGGCSGNSDDGGRQAPANLSSTAASGEGLGPVDPSSVIASGGPAPLTQDDADRVIADLVGGDPEAIADLVVESDGSDKLVEDAGLPAGTAVTTHIDRASVEGATYVLPVTLSGGRLDGEWELVFLAQDGRWRLAGSRRAENR